MDQTTKINCPSVDFAWF